VKLLETDVRVNEFKIKLELGKNLPNVMADSTQIQQVILNLIRNAMDAAVKESDQYKEIIIFSSFLSGDNRIKISVKDHGCGIDQDTAEQLFNPFFTTKQTGLGIGLSICKSIVQSHGGELWFLPNADKGTAFHFTLPTVLDENE
jgi:signal transduction histidine kinase